MTGEAVLVALKPRLATLGLSTRPWIPPGQTSPTIAFDDTDSLIPGHEPA